MTATFTPAPRPNCHASCKFSMSMYFGCNRKSVPGNTPTSVQYEFCFIGAGGPGGPSGGGAAPGSTVGGEIAYAGGKPANAPEASRSAATAARDARPRHMLLLPVPDRCIDIHQPQCQRENRHQAEV